MGTSKYWTDLQGSTMSSWLWVAQPFDNEIEWKVNPTWHTDFLRYIIISPIRVEKQLSQGPKVQLMKFYQLCLTSSKLPACGAYCPSPNSCSSDLRFFHGPLKGMSQFTLRLIHGHSKRECVQVCTSASDQKCTSTKREKSTFYFKSSCTVFRV
jgi:hypothetical protein